MKFNILDFLLPRETKFFGLFKNQISHLIRVAQAFRDMAESIKSLSSDDIRTRAADIKEMERQADQVETTIIDELNETFITPFDREDIHTIAVNIDRVIDRLNALANKIDMYAIRKLPKNVINFSTIVVEAAEALSKVIDEMEFRRDVTATIQAIHQMENNADYLFSISVGELFKKEDDPMDVIKYKEVYEHLESVVNGIDSVAKIVRRVIIKQG